jgi:hypothetical protein
LNNIGDIKFLEVYIYEGKNCYIGRWIYEFRQMKQGVHKYTLTDEQIAKLDELGIRWESKREILDNKIIK